MRIAAAKPGDAPRMLAIMEGWRAETPWMPKSHKPEDDLLCLAVLIQTTEVTSLRNWRGVQGFLVRDGQKVQALYLAPAARGQGHGARLLSAAKARVPRLELWCFQASTRARAFYAREGFREVELTDGAGNDDKLPDVRLVWERG